MMLAIHRINVSKYAIGDNGFAEAFGPTHTRIDGVDKRVILAPQAVPQNVG